MEAQAAELGRPAVHRLVGDEVHALAVGRVGEAAERGLAALDREQPQLAGGHVDHARMRLGRRDVARHQQRLAVWREIQRRPRSARRQQQPRGAGAGVAQPDVAVGAVARGAGIGHQRAVAVEHGAAVLAALAVGQQRGAAGLHVEPVQLRELVAALVLGEHEAFPPRARRRRHHAGDRLGVEGQLLAHAQRLADAVHLAGLGEARADQQAAVRGPAADAGAAGVLVAVQALEQFGRDLRHVLADAVADMEAFDRRGLRQRGQGAGQGEQEDGQFRQAHDGSGK
ncbi:hypothetical protein [Pseudoxanthomonas mexicana]|uniref:hypothetical protein n=1 Tax=Pseudoxanthomonas mexicana TaxID=128785 RepID=UPI00398A5E14